MRQRLVSTLLEMLGNGGGSCEAIYGRGAVSTLLEILGLMCLVVVGF